jgi:hypothetical protein
LFEREKDNIVKLKERLFPFKNNIEECRELMENIESNAPNHIGDLISAEIEHENETAALEGAIPDEEFLSRDPGELLAIDKVGDSLNRAIYRRIDISDLNEMCAMARSLDQDQYFVFCKVIRFCKEMKMTKFCKQSGQRLWTPVPPLLMVHGSGGCGKTNLINVITTWAEKILRTNDESHPDQPYIVKAAPTGMAASNIKGLTLHSAFQLNFGNEFMSLSDKNRDSQRTLLANLQILIIDEVSMVKSDMLYQLNMRLQEVKECKDNFGGVCVLLFGDVMQLRQYGQVGSLQFQRIHHLPCLMPFLHFGISFLQLF